MVNSKNIRYPETSNQDQSILAKVFAPTVYIECNILCNYRVKSTVKFEKVSSQSILKLEVEDAWRKTLGKR
jgi:hypothetical protein